MLHTGMLKAFMDGSLGSHTAAMLEPYADDPEQFRLAPYDAPKLNDMTKERVLAGFQIGFHAIGDHSVQMALDAFADAEKAAKEKKIKAANGGDDYRLRIEHAQVATPLQIVKFRDLKVIASMQPSHVLTDMNWAEARLGRKRAAHSYAWAEFLKRGVTLAFGIGPSCRTDLTVCGPLRSHHAQQRDPESRSTSRTRRSRWIRRSPPTPPAQPLRSLPRKKRA